MPPPRAKVKKVEETEVTPRVTRKRTRDALRAEEAASRAAEGLAQLPTQDTNAENITPDRPSTSSPAVLEGARSNSFLENTLESEKGKKGSVAEDQKTDVKTGLEEGVSAAPANPALLVMAGSNSLVKSSLEGEPERKRLMAQIDKSKKELAAIEERVKKRSEGEPQRKRMEAEALAKKELAAIEALVKKDRSGFESERKRRMAQIDKPPAAALAKKELAEIEERVKKERSEVEPERKRRMAQIDKSPAAALAKKELAEIEERVKKERSEVEPERKRRMAQIDKSPAAALAKKEIEERVKKERAAAVRRKKAEQRVAAEIRREERLKNMKMLDEEKKRLSRVHAIEMQKKAEDREAGKAKPGRLPEQQLAPPAVQITVQTVKSKDGPTGEPEVDLTTKSTVEHAKAKATRGKRVSKAETKQVKADPEIPKVKFTYPCISGLFSSSLAELFFDHYHEKGERNERKLRRIGPAGLQSLAQDISKDVGDVVFLVLAYKMNAQEMGYYYEDEWMRGMTELQIDHPKKLIRQWENLRDLLNQPDTLRDIYRFSFDYTKGQGMCRYIETPMAKILIKMFLEPRWKLCESFLNFLDATNVSSINRDQYSNILEFHFMVKDDFSDYDFNGAWPLLLDEFVSFVKTKETQKVEQPGCEAE